MLDLKTKSKKPLFSSEEIDRRRQSLARADAHNRLEGLIPTAESDAIFEALVRGEIDEAEVLQRVRALTPQL